MGRQLQPSERRGHFVQMTDSLVQTLKPLYENCMQLNCNHLDARATPSERCSIQERISIEFGKSIAQLSVRTPSTIVRTLPRKNASSTI
jgi:hypothetical protein